ncbi:MAG: DMT family transporter [Candidatus Thermoplasmatota archaeon]|nr:DMT family transporter [Candidatus Thermoplasmatota archaeon]
MEGQKKAYLLGVLAVLIWSTVASAFKLTLEHMDLPTMVVMASMFSTVVLFSLVLITKRLPKLFSMTRKERCRHMLPGALNPFIYYLFLFWTYDILKAQEAQALNYTWPIVLTVLSILVLKQRIGRLSIAAIGVSFIGVIIVTTRGVFFSEGFLDPLGLGLGLSTAVIWSVYWILNLRDGTDGMIKLFLNFLFGTILTIIFVMVAFGLDINGWAGVAGAAYIGIFEMGVTFLIWLSALRLSRDTSKISNLIYLGPFLSLFFIAWIVGERILPSTVVGLVLISSGILLQRLDDRRKKHLRDQVHRSGGGVHGP